MNFKKKRTLYFVKKRIFKSEDEYTEVCDSSIITVTLKLVNQLKDCELVDIQLNGNYLNDTCKIVIKSNKEVFLSFIKDFANYFSKHVEEIGFSL